MRIEVPKAASDSAVGCEGDQVVQPDHRHAFLRPLQNPMLVEVVDPAIERQMRLSGKGEALDGPLTELEQQIELNPNGVVMEAAGHLLFHIAGPGDAGYAVDDRLVERWA